VMARQRTCRVSTTLTSRTMSEVCRRRLRVMFEISGVLWRSVVFFMVGHGSCPDCDNERAVLCRLLRLPDTLRILQGKVESRRKRDSGLI